MYLIALGLSPFIFCAVLHAWLRTFYGKSEMIWIYIEYAWTIISFAALVIATAQIVAKYDDLTAAQASIDLPVYIDRFIKSAENILEENADEVRAEMSSRYDLAVPDASELTPLWRAKNANLDNAENAYPIIAKSICEKAFGKDWIDTRSSGLRGQFSDDGGKIGKIWASYADFCVSALDISEMGTLVTSRMPRRQISSTLYTVAFSWPFLLALGLSLKFTKTTSDAAAQRAKLNKQPTLVTPPQGAAM